MFGRAKLLALIITLVTLPAAIALIWAYWTGDPTARPLGITKDSIEHYEGTGSVEIITRITWNPERHQKPDSFAMSIRRAFAAKGVETRVVLEQSDVTNVEIVFEVGASNIGPVSVNQVGSKIGPAVAAFRQHVPYEP